MTGQQVATTSNIPIPDPTLLTTQAVDKAINQFKELVDLRLAGVDQTAALLAADLDRRLSALREYLTGRVEANAAVGYEKFGAIQIQFAERDRALAAALAAQKEAVAEQNKASALAIGKSELATKEQIAALMILMTTTSKAADDKIDDLKTRVTTVESRSGAASETRTEQRLNIGQALLAVGVIVAVVSLVVTILVTTR